MGKRILIVQGHPASSHEQPCHALAGACAEGARSGGHSVETVEPAQLEFLLLSDPAQWQEGTAPDALLPAQQAIVGRA